VLWNPKSDFQATLEVKASEVTVMNAMGETRVVKSQANGSVPNTRQVTVELKKGAPVYLQLDEP